MTSPITQFSQWLDDAKNTKAITEPTAMALATVNAAGAPSSRIVLLKAHDERGFVFYTNLESRKADELKHNQNVALCFYWMALDRQVRVEGRVERVSDAEADAYFASRARESQIGAWSSKQSRELPARADLLREVSKNAARFEGAAVPRPPFWGGFRVVPNSIEFWQQGDFRLHERAVFTRVGSGWSVKGLYP